MALHFIRFQVFMCLLSLHGCDYRFNKDSRSVKATLTNNSQSSFVFGISDNLKDVGPGETETHRISDHGPVISGSVLVHLKSDARIEGNLYDLPSQGKCAGSKISRITVLFSDGSEVEYEKSDIFLSKSWERSFYATRIGSDTLFGRKITWLNSTYFLTKDSNRTISQATFYCESEDLEAESIVPELLDLDLKLGYYNSFSLGDSDALNSTYNFTCSDSQCDLEVE